MSECNIREYLYFFLLKQVPRGRVTTYLSLAKALGDYRAARAVAKMLSENPYAPEVPCHRVVYSDGRIGGYTHPEGVKRKIELLRSEGVEVKNGKIVNFSQILFEDFKSDFPLKKLREEQIKICSQARIEDDFTGDFLVGVDVSYDGNTAYSCAVVYDGSDYTEFLSVSKVDFPYIPTYLSFREFPPIKDVLSKIPKRVWEKSVVLVDGNGLLHPFRCGLATYVGVKLNLPTIGVAKSKLCGVVRGDRIFVDSCQVGWFIKSGKKKGIYVSPGNRVSVDSSKNIVLKNLKYRVPEVLRRAHIISNKIRRGQDFSM